MIERISISFDTNAGNQYFFLLFNEKIIGKFDTYYFALDNRVLPNEESFRKVKLVLISLLDIWKKIFNNNLKGTCFLPIDFSDQYIGGIKINHISDSILEIFYGYTTSLSGSNINPSDYNSKDLNIDDVHFREEKFIITKDDFILSLELIKSKYQAHK